MDATTSSPLVLIPAGRCAGPSPVAAAGVSAGAGGRVELGSGAGTGAAGAGAANAMGTNRVIAAAANERMLNERICVMKGKNFKRVIVSE